MVTAARRRTWITRKSVDVMSQPIEPIQESHDVSHPILGRSRCAAGNSQLNGGGAVGIRMPTLWIRPDLQIGQTSSAGSPSARFCFWRQLGRNVGARRPQHPSDDGQLLRTMAVGQEAVVADACEAARQNVHQKAADELVGREGHRFVSVSIGVVFPAERHALAVELRDPRVGDRHAMRVAGQVLEHLWCAAERWFGIDHPLSLDRLSKEPFECGCFGQRPQSAGKNQLLASIRMFDQRNKLAAKHATQYPHGQEEVFTSGDPGLTVRGYSTGRHDAVQMRMVQQVLAPGVQHGQKTYLGPQVLTVGGDLQKRLGRRPKQQAVNQARIVQRQRPELGRQREHDMEVGHVDQLGRAGFEPAGAGGCLALWAVAIAARVVREAAMAAGVARFFVSAQRGGATGRQVLDRTALFAAKYLGVSLQEFGSRRAKYVANLGRRAVYTVSIVASASKGLVTDMMRSVDTAV